MKNYVMGIARATAEKSQDPSTKVGAVIVDENNMLIATGYNAFPTRIKNGDLPWDRDADSALDTKYPYVVHAEVNAILKTAYSLDGCSIYVTLYPCNECAKMIIQSGIESVYYCSNKYAETDSVRAAARMFELAGIHVEQVD